MVLVSEAQTSWEVSTRAVERGRHFTIMETVRQKTNDASFSTNRYTILGNAINRLDEDGNYVECKPVVKGSGLNKCIFSDGGIDF
jgi:hypothetical protein